MTKSRIYFFVQRSFQVDCTEHKKTCDKFGVSGFPTLKIFRRGELSSDYEGPREADGIVKYMRGQVGPSSKEIKALADLEKFLDHEEHAVIGDYTPHFFREYLFLKKLLFQSLIRC